MCKDLAPQRMYLCKGICRQIRTTTARLHGITTNLEVSTESITYVSVYAFPFAACPKNKSCNMKTKTKNKKTQTHSFRHTIAQFAMSCAYQVQAISMKRNYSKYSNKIFESIHLIPKSSSYRL